MTRRPDAASFAEAWIAAWNRKDVEGVLGCFSDKVVFTSPRAKVVTGSPRIEGKEKLRQYWNAAITQIQTMQFTLDHVIGEGNRIGIVYVSEINGKRMRCVEFLLFGDDGLVCEGEAMHGAEI